MLRRNFLTLVASAVGGLFGIKPQIGMWVSGPTMDETLGIVSDWVKDARKDGREIQTSMVFGDVDDTMPGDKYQSGHCDGSMVFILTIGKRSGEPKTRHGMGLLGTDVYPKEGCPCDMCEEARKK